MQIEKVDYRAFRIKAWEMLKKNLALTVMVTFLAYILTMMISQLPLLAGVGITELFIYQSLAGMFESALIYIAMLSLASFLGYIFYYGYLQYLDNVAAERKVGITDLFVGFKNLKQVFNLFLLNILTNLVVGVVFVCIAVVTAPLMFALWTSGEVTMTLVLVGALGALVAVLALVRISIMLFFALVACAVDGLGPVQAMKLSHQLTKENKGSVLMIMLQMTVWMIAGLLVFVVGLLVAVPFIVILLITYYRAFKAAHEGTTTQMTSNKLSDPNEASHSPVEQSMRAGSEGEHGQTL